MKEKHLHVIQNGTVVDHIPAGLARQISDLIRTKNDMVMIGINLDSALYGKKDILKYSERVLSEQELQIIAVIAPEATISVILEGKVANKRKTSIPDVIENIFVCPNPKCISGFESVATKFYSRPIFRCYYCERSADIKDGNFLVRKMS